MACQDTSAQHSLGLLKYWCLSQVLGCIGKGKEEQCQEL